MYDQAPTQDQDVFSERKETLVRVLDLGERFGLGEKTAAQRLELVSQLDEESFMTVLQTLHETVAPDTPQEIQSKQASLKNPAGEVTAYLAKPDERRSIVLDALSAIQKVSNMREAMGHEEAVLQRIADIVGYTITSTHFYEDGNGRTSRVAAELIRHGTTEHENLELLGESRDISRARGGMIMIGYIPRVDANPGEIINTLVAEDLPLTSSLSDYRKQVWGAISTPYDGYDA